MSLHPTAAFKHMLRGAALAVLLISLAALSPAVSDRQDPQPPQEKPADKPILRAPIERAVVLNDLWNIQSSEKAKGTGEEISRPGFRIDGWYPALVPSTVLGTLVQNNVHADLYVGDNLKAVPTEPFQSSWWYRREFIVPMGAGLNRAQLEFDGLNYRADIWLNGARIAEAATTFGPFRRFAIDVTDAVRTTEKNVLAIEVFPPKKGEPAIGFVDWNPAPPDNSMGLWREVRIRATGDVSIEFPFVVTKLDLETLKEARLTVSAELRNHADRPVSGKLEGRLESLRFSQEVSLEAGETSTVTFSPESHPELVLKDPRVWWTHDLGKPELYTLIMAFEPKRDRAQEKAEADRLAAEKPAEKTSRRAKTAPPPRGFVSDIRGVRFGIREVSDYINEQGHRGYKLNGKKILIRGAGWTDDLLLDVRRRKLASEILYARHANLNALRLEGFWGTSRDLYNLCDENGILLMVGWSCHWEWENHIGKPAGEPYGGITSPEDIDLIAESWRDQLLWLRNHPSIFVWAQASDMLPHPDLERRYIEIQKEVDPTRPTLASTKGKTSTISGPTGVKMLGPYDYVPPVYWYVDTRNGGAYGFNTETGPGPQVPPVDSLRKMFAEKDLWPINDVWSFRSSRGRFDNLDRYNEAMERRLGPAATVEEYATKAQFLNYEGMRAMFEAFTANKHRATGVIQWMFNSAWPSLWWQLYDHYLNPTGAFYGARKAGEPVHILYNYGSGEIVAVNNTFTPAPGLKAVIRVLDFDLKEVIAKTVDFALRPDEVLVIDSLRLPDGMSPTFFLDLRLLRAKGQLVDANFYALSSRIETLDEEKTTWYVTPVKDFADLTALNGLQPVMLKARDRSSRDGLRTRVTLDLENPSPHLAFMIEIQVVRALSGETVLPVFLDDNYISLLPGEKRRISGYFFTEDLGGEQPKVRVTGWNVQEP
jgi:exo-1,4-beta-D-glucosaminidase